MNAEGGGPPWCDIFRIMSKSPSGCLGFLFRLFRSDEDGDGDGGGGAGDALPYRKKKYLFTKAEKSFYLVLLSAVPEEFVVFAKVRMADVIEVGKGTKGWQGFQNRLNSKHFDFVICDREWLEPQVAVELDDSSHDGEKRRARDEFVDAAAKAAGLAVLRVKARQAYDVRELAIAVGEKLKFDAKRAEN
jgi:hypothetical protein